MFRAGALVLAFLSVALFLAATPAPTPRPSSSQVQGQQSDEGGQKANDSGTEAQHAAITPSADLPTADHQNQGGEQHKTFWEWVAGFFSEVNFADVAIAMFTGMLWWSTRALWRETKRLAEGADDQSKKMTQSIDAAVEANKISATDRRAWIAIESVKLIQPIVIPNLDLVPHPDYESARMTRLRIQVVLRNIGHSPASKLKVSCKFLDGSEIQPYVPDRHVRYFGYVFSEGGSVVLPSDREIRTFEFWGPLPRNCFVDAPTPHFPLALEVCATYRISTDTDTHKTQFAYRDALNISSLPRNDEISLTRDGGRDSDPT